MIEVRNWISILGISEQNNKFDIFVHWFKLLYFFHMTVKGFSNLFPLKLALL
jgi:hypothetical protein